MKTTLFFTKVYELVKQIPAGKVATYQQIATLAGNKNASRAVGFAMRKNPDLQTIPCHRVVGSDGKLHGYIKGIEQKKKLLEKEGIILQHDKIDLTQYMWNNTTF